MRDRFKIVQKVVAVFLLLFVAMAVALLLINGALKKHAGLLIKIEDPNLFINTWDNALSSLERSGSAMNRYSNTNDSLDLFAFEEERLKVNSGIDTLYKLATGDAERKVFVDTLATLIDRRMVLYTTRAYEIVRNKNMASFDNAIRRFADVEIAKAKAEPANVAKDENNAPIPKNKNRNNFWQRLFTRKYKKEALQDSIAKVKKLSKAQTSHMISELRKTELLVKESNIKQMLSLMADEQELDNQIYNLTRKMERAEIRATRQQLTETSDSLGASTNGIMISLAIAALIFMVFFTILIQRDVKREMLIKRELDAARKVAEDLAKARQDFAASMSHEIRTPLNALIGFSEQLSKTKLDEGQDKMVDALVRSSNHLLSVINPVLDYGKLISGKAEIAVAPFDINEVLADTKVLFEHQAENKHIQLNIGQVEPGYNIVEGDVVKLKQVLFNLVSNAVKFTLKGHINVSCMVGDKKGTKTVYRFMVEDTGIGIASDKLATVFEEFTQADNSITREYGGTGLGLNIVKRLVEMQSGHVNVDSKQGQGSCFMFEIPYAISKDEARKEQSQQTAPNSLVGKTILICDDEEMNRMLLEHILSKFGAKVIETAGAKEMLEALEKAPVDLVLLDLHMPGMSGIDALKTLRSHADGNIAKTPVIVVTGDVREGERMNSLKAGMSGYLAKPFVEAQLLQLILSNVKG